MFETSVVRERVAPQRRAGVFAASIAAHTVVIAGVVAASISNVSFPKSAPNEILPLVSIAPPPEMPMPRGNPNAPRQPQPSQPHQAQVTPHQQTAPPPDTTPSLIPSTTPSALTSPSTDIGPATGTDNGSSERWGDLNGDPNAIDIGQVPSSNTVGTPDMIYHPGADVKPATILYRVQPVYPRAGIAAKLPGWVIVRCVIGKDGQAREITVEKSSMQMFEQPALDALRQWKFAPGYYHGQAVDTYFELKVTFQVN